MREKKYKASEKIVNQMSRDGLAQKNLFSGEIANISYHEADDQLAEHERDYAIGREPARPCRPPPFESRGRLRFKAHEDATGAERGRLRFTAKEQAGEQPEGSVPTQDMQEGSDARNGVGFPGDSSLGGEDGLTAGQIPGWAPYRPKVWNQTLVWKSGKWTTEKIGRAGKRWIHNKISEVEDDNSGVQAAHLEEKGAEHLYKAGSRYLGSLKKDYRRHKAKVAKKINRTANVTYLRSERARMKLENFDSKGSYLSKLAPGAKEWQKKRLQRNYAKRLRKSEKAAGEVAKVGEKAAAKAARASSMWIARAVRRVIAFFSNAISWAFAGISAIVILLLGLVLLIVLAALLSYIFIVSTSYLAEDVDIHDSSVLVTKLEAELDLKIAELPSLPEWSYIDEFRYDLDPISHNPFVLMAWLTAKFDDFKSADVQPFLNELHSAQYDLQTEVEIEVRERTYIDDDGEEQTEQYNYYILNVTLRSKSIEEIIEPEMQLDESLEESKELRDRFNTLMETKGNHQSVANPFDFDWTSGYSSIYGYRLDPLGGGALQFHRGLDIPMPTGTPIRAGVTGTVIETGYNDTFGNFIVIEDDKGKTQVKYAHCDRLNLTGGQLVKAGETIIATVGNTGGSTGSHVHIEVKENGQYLNPIYMVEWEAVEMGEG